MNSINLFIKAGYPFRTENEEGISYYSDVESDNYGNTFYNCITFWNDRSITTYREKTNKNKISEKEALEMSFKVLQAINKQIKELGWKL